MLSILLALAAASATTVPSVPAKPPVIVLRRMPTPTMALLRGMAKLTPQEAVMKAADAAPRGVYGVFELDVHRAEAVGPNIYLNSQDDYRDPRNLSVAIGPKAQAELRVRLGQDLDKALIGHEVRVLGYAHTVRIDFTANGKPSGKYYFQTHVPVGDANQIELAD